RNIPKFVVVTVLVGYTTDAKFPPPFCSKQTTCHGIALRVNAITATITNLQNTTLIVLLPSHHRKKYIHIHHTRLCHPRNQNFLCVHMQNAKLDQMTYWL